MQLDLVLIAGQELLLLRMEQPHHIPLTGHSSKVMCSSQAGGSNAIIPVRGVKKKWITVIDGVRQGRYLLLSRPHPYGH
jgi:hypothetical protein